LALLASITLLIVLANLKDRFPMFFNRSGILFSAFTPILTFVMYIMLTNSIRRFGRLVKAKESAGF